MARYSDRSGIASLSPTGQLASAPVHSKPKTKCGHRNENVHNKICIRSWINATHIPPCVHIDYVRHSSDIEQRFYLRNKHQNSSSTNMAFRAHITII